MGQILISCYLLSIIFYLCRNVSPRRFFDNPDVTFLLNYKLSLSYLSGQLAIRFPMDKLHLSARIGASSSGELYAK